MLGYGSLIITGIVFILIYHNKVYLSIVIYLLQATPLNNVREYILLLFLLLISCWPTSQRREDNLGDNFKSWIGRHNPRDDVELYVK